MNFAAVTQASLAIKIHLATVIPAFFLGTWLIFASRKGSILHRIVGITYLTLMSITAITTIFIREIRHGQFSFLHLFIPLTIWSVSTALIAIRRKDIRAHRNAMIGMYVGGLLIAGSLTFLPGRLMHRLFFGEPVKQQSQPRVPALRVRGTKDNYLSFTNRNANAARPFFYDENTGVRNTGARYGKDATEQNANEYGHLRQKRFRADDSLQEPGAV